MPLIFFIIGGAACGFAEFAVVVEFPALALAL
jgi:hypothetical protein